MAWTNPVTFAAGVVVTAASLNSQIRDNLLETMPAKAVAKGDRFVATAASVLGRAAVGADGAVLIENSACDNRMAYNLNAGSYLLPNSAVGPLTYANSPCVYSAAKLTFYHWSTTNWAGLGLYSNGSLWLRSEGLQLYANDTASPRAPWVSTGCTVWIGVDEGTSTCNTQASQMHYGLIIAGSGREHLTLKFSASSHGMTDLTDATTHMSMAVDGGGIYMNAYSPHVATAGGPWKIAAYRPNSDTSKANNSTANFVIQGMETSGCSVCALQANGNIWVVGHGGSSVFIFDNEGDFHADAGISASAYDGFDDVELVRALEVERGAAGLVRERWDEFLRYGRRDLEAAKIATFNDGPGGDGSVFVNYTALARLHSGAIWQLGRRAAQLRAEVHRLRRAVERGRARLALAGGAL